MKTPFAWLENELPLWVKEALITEKNAQILLERYHTENRSKAPLIALVIFGALFIGIGVIAIFAYNWNELGRYAKSFIALALLLGSQYAAFWLIRRKSDSLAASEGISLFWFLALGCSLAIIGQSYNLGGDLVDFLRTWVVLSLPIIYLFNSRSVALLVFIIITYLITVLNTLFGYDEMGFLNWILLALWLPWYALHLKNHLRANSTVFLNLAFAIGAFNIFFSFINFSLESSSALFYLLIFCSGFWLFGVLLYDENERFYKRVFEFLSKITIFVALLILCKFSDITRYFDIVTAHPFFYATLAIFGLLFVLFCIYRRDRLDELLIPLSPVAFYIIFLLAVPHDQEYVYYSTDGTIKVLFNIYVIIGSLAMVIGAARKANIALANQGLIIISILTVLHFFDADFSFLLKGVGFIIIGVLFLGLNLLMKRFIKDKR